MLLNAIVILVLTICYRRTRSNTDDQVLFSGSNVTGGLEIDTDMFDDTTLIEQEVVEGGGNYLVLGSAFGVTTIIFPFSVTRFEESQALQLQLLYYL